MRQLGEAWAHMFPLACHRIANLMVERIDLVSGGLKIQWRELGWKALIKEFAPSRIGAELVELEEVVSTRNWKRLSLYN
jgi:hypothetical protein